MNSWWCNTWSSCRIRYFLTDAIVQSGQVMLQQRQQNQSNGTIWSQICCKWRYSSSQVKPRCTFAFDLYASTHLLQVHWSYLQLLLASHPALLAMLTCRMWRLDLLIAFMFLNRHTCNPSEFAYVIRPQEVLPPIDRSWHNGSRVSLRVW